MAKKSSRFDRMRAEKEQAPHLYSKKAQKGKGVLPAKKGNKKDYTAIAMAIRALLSEDKK